MYTSTGEMAGQAIIINVVLMGILHFTLGGVDNIVRLLR